MSGNPKIAAILLACTLQHVRDPQTGKLGWVQACGEATGRKHYLRYFDRDYEKALKHARQYFRSYRPPHQYTVSLNELKVEH